MTNSTKTRVIHIRNAPPSWKRDNNYVYIGRTHNSSGYGFIPESIWSNPYVIHSGQTREESIEKYKKYLKEHPEITDRIEEIRGKTLVCWCHPLPCHGDILVNMLHPNTVQGKLEFKGE